MKFQHLNLTNRCVIEKHLAFQSSFREIAAIIGCSTSTVTREVRNNREFISSANTVCANYISCHQKNCAEAQPALLPARPVIRVAATICANSIFAKIKLIHPSPKRQEKSEPQKSISCIIVEKDTREENRSGNNSGNLRRNQTVP